MNTLKVLVLTATAFVAFAAVSFAQAAETLTADQHAALAQELQQKAAVASQRAAIHEAMGRRGGPPKAAPGAMKSHCEQLTAQYRTKAADHAAKAADHRLAAM